ncbi:MAG: RpiB/LacA/LacB family sugar-phosphate isomerase [Candidatus Limnocylindrales bacterium]
MNKTFAIGADHAGRVLQDRVCEALTTAGHRVLVVTTDPSDDDFEYPEIAQRVATEIREGRVDRGVLICGSGAGMTVAANKLHGIRACVAHDVYTAHQMVEHDDVNVLALGARVIGQELAAEIVWAFASASFSGEERHRRRVAKVARLEAAG